MQKRRLTAEYVRFLIAVQRGHQQPGEPSAALGHDRKAWLFAGRELAGKRAAVAMSLVHSTRLHSLDPYTYLRDVLERLPTHLNSRIDELVPHRCRLAEGSSAPSK